jgi:hypothetical protein
VLADYRLAVYEQRRERLSEQRGRVVLLLAEERRVGPDQAVRRDAAEWRGVADTNRSIKTKPRVLKRLCRPPSGVGLRPGARRKRAATCPSGVKRRAAGAPWRQPRRLASL